jgi:transcriptional regulator
MADEMTQQEIADQLGCSRQNIEQIIRRAFMRVRKRLRAMGITGYSDLSIGDYLVDGLRSGKRPME